jgi:hypothetical protein
MRSNLIDTLLLNIHILPLPEHKNNRGVKKLHIGHFQNEKLNNCEKKPPLCGAQVQVGGRTGS